MWHIDGHLLFGEDEPLDVPYPYQPINAFYINRRRKLRSRGNELSDELSDSVFIDSFVKNKCDAQAIQILWGGSWMHWTIPAIVTAKTTANTLANKLLSGRQALYLCLRVYGQQQHAQGRSL